MHRNSSGFWNAPEILRRRCRAIRWGAINNDWGWVSTISRYLNWLVVWLPSILFSHDYWKFHHPNWLSYFSEGFKPPTSQDRRSLKKTFRNSSVHIGGSNQSDDLRMTSVFNSVDYGESPKGTVRDAFHFYLYHPVPPKETLKWWFVGLFIISVYCYCYYYCYY